MSNVSAQDTLLDKAAGLLSQRDAAAAYALLAPAEAQRAGEPRFDYLLGVAALDAGHVTRAIFALERAVLQKPDDTLPRAELGRAYLAAGDPDRARAELRLARGGALPEEASAAIDRVINVINQVVPSTGPQLSGYLEFGAGRDSNVNSATNLGEFAIPGFGGILFQTSRESRRQGDNFATAAGGVNAELALSPTWKAVAAANLRGTANHQTQDLNTVLLDATLALRRTAGLQSQSIGLQNSSAWVGAARYRTASGLTGQWQWQLDAASQASLFGQWSHQNYMGQAERNTDRGLLGLGYARDIASAGLLAYGSAYGAREQASADEFAHFGHHATGLRLGIEKRLGPALTGSLEWRGEQRRYGGSEPFFETARRDRQRDLAAGLRYDADARWQLSAQLQYTRAASNVVLYDYTRSVFQITVRRSFE